MTLEEIFQSLSVRSKELTAALSAEKYIEAKEINTEILHLIDEAEALTDKENMGNG